MRFKNFRIGAIFRVALIFGFAMAGALLSVRGLWFTAGLMWFSAVLCSVSLFRWAEKGNSGILKFFEGVRNKDYSISGLGLPKGKTFDELNENLTAILHELRTLDYDLKESRFFPLQVLDALPIPVMVLSDDKFFMSNAAAALHFNVKPTMPLQHLMGTHPEVYSVIKFMWPGEKRPVEIITADGPKIFALTKNRFITGGIEYTVISAQNIRSELDEKESDAWQKLVRVMAHEMMNSLTPVVSLSETLLQTIREGEMPEKNDLENALHGITRRSEGLMRFVDAYRKIARLPQPVKNEFNITKWLRDLINTSELKPQPIFMANEENLLISADQNLLGQAFTNLLKNASEALVNRESPEIKVNAYRDYLNRICIEVSDNGHGMDDEVMEKAFIPFFTTKMHGSGIGLSLCKQIIRLHGGDINITRNSPQGLKVNVWLPVGK